MASESEEQDKERDRDQNGKDDSEENKGGGGGGNDNGGDSGGDSGGGFSFGGSGGGGGGGNDGGGFDFSMFGNPPSSDTPDFGSFFSGNDSGTGGMSGLPDWARPMGNDRSSGKDSSSRGIEFNQPSSVSDALWAKITGRNQSSSQPDIASTFANNALRGLAPNDVAELRRDPNSNQSFNILSRFAAQAWQQESGRQAPNQNDPRDLQNFRNYLQDWVGSLKAGQNPPLAQDVRTMLQQQPAQSRQITYNPPGGNPVVNGLVNSATVDPGQGYVDATRTTAVGQGVLNPLPTTAVGQAGVPVAPSVTRPVTAGDPTSLEWLGRAQRAADEADRPYSGNLFPPPLTTSSGSTAPTPSPGQPSAGTGPNYDREPYQPSGQLPAESRPEGREPYQPSGETLEQMRERGLYDTARSVLDRFASPAEASELPDVPTYEMPTNTRPAPVPTYEMPDNSRPNPSGVTDPRDAAGYQGPPVPQNVTYEMPDNTREPGQVVNQQLQIDTTEAAQQPIDWAVHLRFGRDAAPGEGATAIASAIADLADGRNVEAAQWAKADLDRIAQAAWFVNENGGRSMGMRPKDAPPDYIRSWEVAWANGDENIPLAKELNAQMRQYLGDRYTPGGAFDWHQYWGDSGERLAPSQIKRGPMGDLVDCGPVAAVAMARAVGLNPDQAKVFDWAVSHGYHDGNEFQGTGSFVKMLDDMGVHASVGGMNWGVLDQQVAAGNPVVLSTPGHYWVVSDRNEQGQYYVGQTGKIVGTGFWASRGEIERNRFGNPNQMIVLTDTRAADAARFQQPALGRVGPRGAAFVPQQPGQQPPPQTQQQTPSSSQGAIPGWTPELANGAVQASAEPPGGDQPVRHGLYMQLEQAGMDYKRKLFDAAMDAGLTAEGITDPGQRAYWKQAMAKLAAHEDEWLNPFTQINDLPGRPTKSSVNSGPRGYFQFTPGTFAAYSPDGTTKGMFDPVTHVRTFIRAINKGRYRGDPGGMFKGGTYRGWGP